MNAAEHRALAEELALVKPEGEHLFTATQQRLLLAQTHAALALIPDPVETLLLEIAPKPKAEPAPLTPEEKIGFLKTMGFSPFREPHQPACPADTGEDDGEDNGFICNCLRPEVCFSSPKDVQDYFNAKDDA